MTTESYSRSAILIRSATRNDVKHLIDFEGDGEEKVVCTCEAFILGGARPCKHIKNATIPIPV